jgi:ADP-ribose pyrophosphatase YjhB (NUDIX family)
MLSGPLPKSVFDDIFSKVPRLTVEVIVVSPKGVLLTKRQIEPCKGRWHIPGGTVRFGEPLTDAVHRVAKIKLDRDVIIKKFLGYIEYPSHHNNGLDSPVGLTFETEPQGPIDDFKLDDNRQWFTVLPDNMHDEQKHFLLEHKLTES